MLKSLALQGKYSSELEKLAGDSGERQLERVTKWRTCSGRKVHAAMADS